MDIRYPQGDWTGTLPGAAEVEFQFYTYPLAILYKLFGVHEWFGRALNIAIYVPGAVLLFLLVRRLFGDAEALVAAFAYSFVPLSFFYTRTFQPDAFSAFFALLGVYAILRWIETDTWAFLALSVVGAALAGLLKPNNLHIGVPFAYLLYRRFGWRFIKKPVIWVFGVSVLLPVAAWYAHAYRLWVEYGNSYFRYYLIIGMYAVGASFTHVSGTLAMRLVKTIATPAGLPLMLLGLIQRPRDSNWVLHWWLAGFLASVAMAPRLHGGHDYYQLPAVFITSAWMGSGAVFLWTFQRSRRPILWRSLTIIMCGSILGLMLFSLPFVTVTSAEEWERVKFGKAVEAKTRPGDIIITVQVFPQTMETRRRLRVELRDVYFLHRGPGGKNLGGYPWDLYLSHRKGWSLNEVESTPEYVEVLRQGGARYFVTFYPDVLEVRPELKEALESCCKRIDVGSRGVLYRLDGPVVPGKPNDASACARAKN